MKRSIGCGNPIHDGKNHLPCMAVGEVIFAVSPVATSPHFLGETYNKGVKEMSKYKQGLHDHSWEKWLGNHANPVEKLEPSEEDAYRDLVFLKRVLKRKRIVMLGESSHGAAEFISSKVRLIQYLHEELAFDVIAFESGLGETHFADLYADKSIPLHTMLNAIISVWHTQEMIPLFEYVKKHKKSDVPLRLSGFDLQPTGTYHAFLRNWFKQVNPAMA
ncbi:erythromycin esterase family protein [Laceyella putida]|uniref:Erythromycin esterase family protein n=1 Tax=Laceyella putida TaxID=110101 RepID=A0ABW2RFL6_9BACL